MKLVVGLGNPGPKYETTRHNAGFLALDRLMDRWNAPTATTRNQGEVAQTKVGGEPVLLVKPQTYMNLSGRCVGPLFQFYKCKPEDLIVIYDELDLKPLTFRLKIGGGSGGHNGIKSIDSALGAANNGYLRLRIGIGKPAILPTGRKEIPTEDYVLTPFSDSELERLDPLLDRVADAVELLIAGKTKEAMNQFNRRDPDTEPNTEGDE